jgi:hypothetical protein
MFIFASNLELQLLKLLHHVETPVQITYVILLSIIFILICLKSHNMIYNLMEYHRVLINIVFILQILSTFLICDRHFQILEKQVDFLDIS